MPYSQAVENAQYKASKLKKKLKHSLFWENHKVGSELYWVNCKKIICIECLVQNNHCGHMYTKFKDRYILVSDQLSNKQKFYIYYKISCEVAFISLLLNFLKISFIHHFHYSSESDIKIFNLKIHLFIFGKKINLRIKLL